MVPYYVLSNILGPRHKADGKANRNTFPLGVYISLGRRN